MALQALVPHGGAMLLIEDPFDGGDDWATASVRIAEDTMFYRPGHGVPSWVGIEYMAQTVALQAGLLAKRAGEDIRIGLLLGSRKFTTAVDYFPLGCILRIIVQQEFLDMRMAVFACRIENQTGQELSVAKLNVYQVDDVSMLTGGMGA